MKKIILFLSGIFMFTLIGIVPASAQSDEPLKLLDEYFGSWWGPKWEMFSNRGNDFLFRKDPYYDGSALKEPIILRFAYNQDIAKTKIKYSLYTFKKTYLQSIGFDTMQGIIEIHLFNNGFGTGKDAYTKPKTESDIEEKLDKIYEFPAGAEHKSSEYGGYTYELFWDGYTNPQFTGQKYSVRSPLCLVARYAETNEIIGMSCIGALETYEMHSLPGLKYRIDTNAEGKKTLSANVFLAYDENRPITKITAVLLTDGCGIGSITYNMVNQGAEAMIANMARFAVAYKTLENPTVDPDNPYIKTFDWNDIKTTRQVKPTSETLDARGEAAEKTQEERAKNVPKPEAYKNYEDFVSALREYFDTEDFIPDWEVFYLGFRLAFIVETDEMTITGINNGFISSGIYYIPDPDDPVRWVFTGLQTIAKPEGITITQTPSGFRVNCENGVYANDLTIYDTAGRMVKKASLSGNTQSQEVSADLSGGIYFVKATGTNGNQPVSATLKFIK